jgi:hypothetical protein
MKGLTSPGFWDGAHRMCEADETGETFERTFKTIAKQKPKGNK